MVSIILDTNKELGQLRLIFLTYQDRRLLIATENHPFAPFISATRITAVSWDGLPVSLLELELAF
jgi:hypothetical protein